jgi:hypothetical protein
MSENWGWGPRSRLVEIHYSTYVSVAISVKGVLRDCTLVFHLSFASVVGNLAKLFQGGQRQSHALASPVPLRDRPNQGKRPIVRVDHSPPLTPLWELRADWCGTCRANMERPKTAQKRRDGLITLHTIAREHRGPSITCACSTHSLVYISGLLHQISRVS